MRFALADCNNFYASCERVFNFTLIGRPVVVLSNNDGCVIARSEEAKALGIPMGAPAFEFQEMFEKNQVAVLSSNYALYGDMSRRVVETLRTEIEHLEVYSIDEAFLSLEPDQDVAFARKLRAKVRKWTGIPICVGIGPTKTLAKIANRLAKKTPTAQGVFEFAGDDETLARVACGDIWGIGRRLTARLQTMSIRTALDLKKADCRLIRRDFGVVVERTVRELNGQSCLELEEIPALRKGVASAKSFGTPVTNLPELEEALASYIARAAEKLRLQNLYANVLQVFLETNPFRSEQPQYNPSGHIRLSMASNHSPTLITAGLYVLRAIYRPGYRYKKTGVNLPDLVPFAGVQLPLGGVDLSTEAKQIKVSTIVDDLNRRLGRDTITFGSMGTKKRWSMRQEKKSPRFTTSWDELMVAKV